MLHSVSLSDYYTTLPQETGFLGPLLIDTNYLKDELAVTVIFTLTSYYFLISIYPGVWLLKANRGLRLQAVRLES